jgi:hypothetical protein
MIQNNKLGSKRLLTINVNLLPFKVFINLTTPLKKFFFGFVLFVIASCEKQPELKWDEIDFYRISERANYELHAVETRGTDSKALEELVYFNSPDTLNELNVTVLKKKYTQYKMNENQIKEISKFFVHYDSAVQKGSFTLTTFCDPVYRDILVFKKDQKIIGVAKVCFGCTQNYLLFGESGMRDVTLDYSGLEKELDNVVSY